MMGDVNGVPVHIRIREAYHDGTSWVALTEANINSTGVKNSSIRSELSRTSDTNVLYIFDGEQNVPVAGHTNVTTVNAATYNVLPEDHILHVTYTGTGAVAIDWKTAQMIKGRMLIVKDAGGNAAANNITITTEGAQTIDGAATLVINTNYGVARLYCDGTNLFAI